MADSRPTWRRSWCRTGYGPPSPPPTSSAGPSLHDRASDLVKLDDPTDRLHDVGNEFGIGFAQAPCLGNASPDIFGMYSWKSSATDCEVPAAITIVLVGTPLRTSTRLPASASIAATARNAQGTAVNRTGASAYRSVFFLDMIGRCLSDRHSLMLRYHHSRACGALVSLDLSVGGSLRSQMVLADFAKGLVIFVHVCVTGNSTSGCSHAVIAPQLTRGEHCVLFRMQWRVASI